MKIRICFTGGGTAGHVFPALAVMESVLRISGDKGIDTRFFWIGSTSGMEKKLLESKGIEFYGIQTGKLRRYFSFSNFTDLFKIKMGIIKAFFILYRKKPDVIFSKGGYVSVPAVFAGRMLGIPVITHESDYTPGLATKINKFFSKIIMVSFKETKSFFSSKYQDKIIVTGNPVRKIFYNADPVRGRKFASLTEKIPVILVLGGSQGAFELNKLINCLAKPLVKDYYVIHQTGEKGFSELPDFGFERYKKYPFIGNEIGDLLAAADLVICRAGAGTILELAASGKASIIIPLRGKGTRGDQVLNAAFMKKNGAAVVLDDNEINPQMLYNTAKILLSDKSKTGNIEKAVKMLDCADSSDVIAEKLLNLAGEGI
ncbi:MAG: undecaprenyldiphospho-muramoylpentapeptide beta-N-acetylglucosaminyltransferase [Spirochaetia bacterium]|jgi:UDP-N-acetylglucosamine--N-acetylmuramyl-(pentapeptide) pyrophosphoryl-undecaprenol N-acetylglucosamine transferase|nr:undecaprenyldiphospho-muramoylpentapeptide beta-N-acetylglucosaminyltransferase [Spirochaetia bacterium]